MRTLKKYKSPEQSISQQLPLRGITNLRNNLYQTSNHEDFLSQRLHYCDRNDALHDYTCPRRLSGKLYVT